MQPPSKIRTVEHPGTEHLCLDHRLENSVLMESLYKFKLSSMHGSRAPEVENFNHEINLKKKNYLECYNAALAPPKNRLANLQLFFWQWGLNAQC